MPYLDQMLKTTDEEWYEAKHRRMSDEEIDLFNHVVLPDCPYCHSADFVSWGKARDGIRRFRCRQCRHTFSPLTGTLFDGHKIPVSEWMEYLLHLFEFHSLSSSATDNRNAPMTGRYWLRKTFSALRNYQENIVLGREVWLDETFFPVIRSKEVLRDGKRLRGISRNKISVAVATDGFHSLLIDERRSKPTDGSTWLAYSGHILPGSHIIHDGENSHSVLTKSIPGLTESVYPSGCLKGLRDSENPMYPINHVHALAKSFMRSHGGYDRDGLQDWMNLLAFILNPPSDPGKKVSELLRLAINTRERVRFRDPWDI